MHIAGHQLLLLPPVRPLAERFGAEFFRAVPESPGVYLMSTAQSGVLYVGKAKNLRRRLGSYRSGTAERLPRRVLRLLLTIERIDWDICSDEAAAIARERELIRALQPRFNSMGVRPPKEWFIGWNCDESTWTLRLDESPAMPGEIRGPFIHARPAFAALLRSLWLRLHPGTSVAETPSRLLGERGPARLTVPRSEDARAWFKQLELFMAGHESEFVPEGATLAPEPPSPDAQADAPPTAPLTFDQQWRAMDTECLVEFYERLRFCPA